MQFIGAFKKFDPKKGTMPKYSSGDFAYIAQIARRILKGRRKKEILWGLAEINFLLGKEELEMMRDLILNADKKEELFFISPSILLKRSMEKNPKLAIKRFPNAEWSELFAILALAHIGQAFKTPENAIRLKGEEKENYLRDFMRDLALEGMEAIGNAEKQEEREFSENREIKRKQEKSAQAQIAGKARHRETNDLKREFVKFRINNPQFKNTRKASFAFYESLPKEKQELISGDINENPDNIYRFFLKAWNESKSGKSTQ